MQDNVEKPERIPSIRSALSSLPTVTVHECERHATPDELCTVHTPELVRFLTETLAEWDPDWPAEIVPGTFPYTPSTARLPDWPLAQAAYFACDADTPIGPKTVPAWLHTDTVNLTWKDLRLPGILWAVSVIIGLIIVI